MSGRNDAHLREKLPLFVLLLAIFLALWTKHVLLYAPTGPTVFLDELLWKENAQRIFNGKPFVEGFYPPLYSVVISPAFFFENWFEVMILINGVLSTLLLVPVWFLARTFLSVRAASVTVLAAALLPFQAIYPDYLLSENLFLGAFATAVLLAIQGAHRGRINAASFGCVLGLCYLTKHLMLPAIPVLIFFWIATPYFLARDRALAETIRLARPNVLIMLAALTATYTPWLVYANVWGGIPLSYVLGFGITGIKSSETTVGSLAMWSGAYASYLLLAAAPFLLPLSLYVAGCWRNVGRFHDLRRETVFLLLLLVLTAGYWLLATQHSFGATYNYPEPVYLIGRYLMFLTPLYVVAGVVALERLSEPHFGAGRLLAAAAIAGTLLAVTGAQAILYGELAWKFPPWLADLPFNAPGAFAYNVPAVSYVALSCMAALGGISWMLSFGKTRSHLASVLAAYAVLLAWQGTIFAAAAERSKQRVTGLHARHVAPFLAADASLADGSLAVYYDIADLPPEVFVHALRFWGVSTEQEGLQWIEGSTSPQPLTKPGLILTQEAYGWPVLLSYQVGSSTYRLYDADPVKPGLLPSIVKFGPTSLIAGRPFNQQPSGNSAIWLTTENATRSTVVVFGNTELRTTVANPSSLSAILPLELFSSPGEVQMYLKDRLTGAVSEPVTVQVTASE